MSVIARSPDGTIRLYCKGSDAKVMKKIRADTPPDLVNNTNANLHYFAKKVELQLCVMICEMLSLPRALTFHRAALDFGCRACAPWWSALRSSPLPTTTRGISSTKQQPPALRVATRRWTSWATRSRMDWS